MRPVERDRAHNCVTFAGGAHLGPVMSRKTQTLNLRVTPDLKELIRLAADRDRRTIANFIEVLVREHCDKQGIGPELKKQPSSR